MMAERSLRDALLFGVLGRFGRPGNSRRPIPLPAPARELLQEHRGEQAEQPATPEPDPAWARIRAIGAELEGLVDELGRLRARR